MLLLGRRAILQAVGGAVAFASWGAPAGATLARSLPLTELARASERILVGVPLASQAYYRRIGGRRRIVTDHRLRVDETLAESASGETEILVRTLGGVVEGVGQLVHGEALLAAGEACLLFLHREMEGAHPVLGMAQGHYRLLAESASVRRLHASPRLPALVGSDDSAVARLTGRELGEARTLIRQALVR